MSEPRTYGEVLRRSFLPEEVLVDARDTEALFEKMHTSLEWRIRNLFSTRLPYSRDNDMSLEALELGKLFGPVVLDLENLPARGYDKDTGEVVVERDERVMGLHFAGLKPRLGLQELRGGLQQAAECIKEIPDHPDKIASLTHREFARLASRLGFQMLQADHIEPREMFSLEVSHDIFNLYNKRDNPLVPQIVTMPADDFVARFA